MDKNEEPVSNGPRPSLTSSFSLSFLLALILSLSTLTLFSPSLKANEMPPRENLIRAKQMVISIQSRVNNLIQYISHGTRDHDDDQPDDDQPGECRQYNNRATCLRANCQWFLTRYRRGYCGDRNPSTGPVIHHTNPEANTGAGPELMMTVRENDFAANLALQGMGRGLFNLGEKIDEALLHHGTPAFWHPWSQACHQCNNLIEANKAAKVSASLPVVGLVRPLDFQPIDVELFSVRQQLLCP